MDNYQRFQLEKYGNILPATKSNLRQDDEEIDNCPYDDFAADAFVFDDGIVNDKINNDAHK
jgi:hypothetical protein